MVILSKLNLIGSTSKAGHHSPSSKQHNKDSKGDETFQLLLDHLWNLIISFIINKVNASGIVTQSSLKFDNNINSITKFTMGETIQSFSSKTPKKRRTGTTIQSPPIYTFIIIKKIVYIWYFAYCRQNPL